MNKDQYLTQEEVAKLVSTGAMTFPPKRFEEARPPVGKGGGKIYVPKRPPPAPEPFPITPPPDGMFKAE